VSVLRYMCIPLHGERAAPQWFRTTSRILMQVLACRWDHGSLIFSTKLLLIYLATQYCLHFILSCNPHMLVLCSSASNWYPYISVKKDRKFPAGLLSSAKRSSMIETVDVLFLIFWCRVNSFQLYFFWFFGAESTVFSKFVKIVKYGVATTTSAAPLSPFF
jgi:hypothetical protein